MEGERHGVAVVVHTDLHVLGTDVETAGDTLGEIQYLLPVLDTDTSRRVEREHDVSNVTAVVLYMK